MEEAADEEADGDPKSPSAGRQRDGFAIPMTVTL
jgi:hypothetical protein